MTYEEKKQELMTRENWHFHDEDDDGYGRCATFYVTKYRIKKAFGTCAVDPNSYYEETRQLQEYADGSWELV